MSIILKGIDLPETNEIRMIAINSNGEAFFNIVKDGIPDKTKISQAIQIPKKHGRIVDLEKLKEEFAMKKNICKECDSFKECDNKTYSKSEICEKFIWVPTILEAEE